MLFGIRNRALFWPQIKAKRNTVTFYIYTCTCIFFIFPLGYKTSFFDNSDNEDSSQTVACILLFEPRHKKTSFCHMRTTKAQISLRIRAV